MACDAPRWLGSPSPQNLAIFLSGAADRAIYSGSRIEQWRIYGPLCEPSFDEPILKETGHPTLAIRWAFALEIIHFSMSDALTDLKQRIELWAQENEPDQTKYKTAQNQRIQMENLFEEMATRPGMFLRTNSGVGLQQYLLGATAGGDWLGLPEVARFNQVKEKIERVSLDAYGSHFAGYRIYNHDGGAAHLLTKWAGVEAVSPLKPTKSVG